MKICLELSLAGSVALLRAVESGESLVVGSSSEADLWIPGTDQESVRCVVRRTGNTLVLENHAPGGTPVNDARVEGAKRLADGDSIRLGETVATVVFAESDDPASKTKTLTVAELSGESRSIALVEQRTGARYPLADSRLGFGTGCENELVIDDPYASSRHGQIRFENGAYLVRDLGSRNGTLLNGTKVRDAELRVGDVLRVGQSELKVESQNVAAVIGSDALPGMVGSSAAMGRLRALLTRLAAVPAPVLVVGETGTGKEVAARALHSLGPRAGSAFVALNCGALSRNLIESELFGHEKGAFTGATKRKLGAFENAKGGTIFLDEIGELPLDLQPQLLRVLENSEIRRVGGNETITVDARVIAATNRNLETEVAEGRFRDDLFHRLHVLGVKLPTLRERPEDVAPLARHFVDQLSPAGQRVAIAADALIKLETYEWPGNVRELRNVMHRAVLMRTGPKIVVDDITFSLSTFEEKVKTQSAREGGTLAEIEREAIRSALIRARGNRTRAAQSLGVSRSTIHRKLEEYEIDVGAFDDE